MLRRRLGDDRFFALLKEMRRRYEFRSVTTEGFRALVKEHLPPRVTKESIDAFFDNWAYSTGVPELKVSTSIKGKAPSVRLTGEVQQKRVASDFSVEIPVEIHFAKGPSQTVWVRTSDEPAPFSVTLKQTPVRVTIPAGTGVLARR
jgi:aminopeptidase N